MKNFEGLLRASGKFVKRNASTILTCAGGAGVVVTTVMAVKATPKALRLIEEAKNEKGEDLTKFEVVKAAGLAYVPTVISGVTTIACIVGANMLNKRQQAALMSAYAMLDNSYKQYRKKVEELYGNEANNLIRAELAKDKYEEEDEILEEDDGKLLFYDQYSERYFRATHETVLQAEYELNRVLNMDYYASLNEFYCLLGIDGTDYGDYVGWSAAQLSEMNWSSWIEFWHEKVEMEDGMEAIIVHITDPTADFDEY